MRFIVERCEETSVILLDDNEKSYIIPKDKILFPFRDGDILSADLIDNIPVNFRFDKEETDRQRARMNSLFNKLRNRSDEK